ncbi:MAG: SoxR reducing system RseC family protein [Candidatus Saganbacteria bacterium]|nr:SoxR reducing system RseC family protein [Candidatus Saganbacteria bacterium]
MREQGVVAGPVRGNIVLIAFQRSAACDKCRLCHNVGEGLVGIEAVNDLGAKQGDIVEIEIPSQVIVKASFIVFIVPVLGLLLGYVIGSTLARILGLAVWQEWGGIVCGLGSAALTYFIISLYDRSIQQAGSLRAKVIKVIFPA